MDYLGFSISLFFNQNIHESPKQCQSRDFILLITNYLSAKKNNSTVFLFRMCISNLFLSEWFNLNCREHEKMTQTKCGAFYYLRILMILGSVATTYGFHNRLILFIHFHINEWRELVSCAFEYPGNNNETTKHRSLANICIGSERYTFSGK